MQLSAVEGLTPFAKRGDINAVGVLKKTLKSDWNAPVKTAAGKALVQVALEHDPHVAQARTEALDAIAVVARLGSTDAVAALSAAAEDEMPFVRSAALKSLILVAFEGDSVEEKKVKA